MDKEEFNKAMECKRKMDSEARILSMTKLISNILNNDEITYDEFLAIFNNIIDYCHYEAIQHQNCNEFDYKVENGIPLNQDLDYMKMDEEDVCGIIVDIDDMDGEWFIIPAIG